MITQVKFCFHSILEPVHCNYVCLFSIWHLTFGISCLKSCYLLYFNLIYYRSLESSILALKNLEKESWASKHSHGRTSAIDFRGDTEPPSGNSSLLDSCTTQPGNSYETGRIDSQRARSKRRDVVIRQSRNMYLLRWLGNAYSHVVSLHSNALTNLDMHYIR